MSVNQTAIPVAHSESAFLLSCALKAVPLKVVVHEVIDNVGHACIGLGRGGQGICQLSHMRNDVLAFGLVTICLGEINLCSLVVEW
jgi:hypothetical protein